MIKIGNDLLKVERIRDILSEKYGERFLRHVCRDDERVVLDETAMLRGYSVLVEGCAILFSAKEAVSKVLETGIAKLGNPDGVSLRDIEIYHEPSGAPRVRLHGKAKEIAESKGFGELSISISTEIDRSTLTGYVSTAAAGEYSILRKLLNKLC